MNKYFLVVLITITGILNGGAQNLPKTDKEFNNNENDFQFVVVSDRTGGMQPGVFAKALDKVNLVQPEFVISVGDLIDGYTKDPKIWNAQWDEFDSIVNKLEMPFYHVSGNHDTSNELLLEAWRARLGKDYYHFKYKNVLFLAINTDEIEGGGLSQTQINYFEQTLAKNQDVRWTLLFMHRPVWSYEDDLGYKQIEKALGKRQYTLFSGHHHHYRYKNHNNMEHFTLATSGGGSNLRGANVGEFHHISWITMKAEGPKIAHLELSGIYDKNVVLEADYEDIQVLRKGKWLEVSPYVNATNTFNSFATEMIFRNDTKRNMIIKGKIKDTNGLTFSPNTISDTLSPSTSKTIPLTVSSNSNNASIQTLNNTLTNITLNGGFLSALNDSIFISTSKTLLTDWNHTLLKTENNISIDGDLNDWNSSDFIDVLQPQFLKEDWDWTGPKDGNFKFSLSRDNKQLYIGISFKDDKLIFNNNIKENQDKFYVNLNSSKQQIKLEFIKNSKSSSPFIIWNEGQSKNIDAILKQNSNELILEFSLPLKDIFDKKMEDMDWLRVNIGVMDHDQMENTKPSILWWRPLNTSPLNYKDNGKFYIEK
ncbi:beta-galactosidase [Formosa agariphila KMM 3901]|uniref:Beta-galactosidase n=1 Tax=Formosa agariphila (strain DSM 15362 / KCTC 12365 / LMG 23005 / KMM 3901 / M-2Alg 35-1) TaxID=1347342 RepID=T2KQK6_FORAG|nr:metallophosphoesterase [Formosa agariphila]CDF80783.1 beta-galactosidase [Formosa agariphila KMM 3901]